MTTYLTRVFLRGGGYTLSEHATFADAMFHGEAYATSNPLTTIKYTITECTVIKEIIIYQKEQKNTVTSHDTSDMNNNSIYDGGICMATNEKKYDGSFEDKFETIGSGWVPKSGGAGVNLVINKDITLKKEDRLFVFKTKEKKTESHPDYVLCKAKN